VDFETQTVRDFGSFLRTVSVHERGWVYRGQREDWRLETTLDRTLDKFGLCRKHAFEIETHIIRDFRRRYPSGTPELVKGDTLHCLSLMQHHGAPTRLLDCTYSPFVAAKFALDYCCKTYCAAIWCFRGLWSGEAAKAVVGEGAVGKRGKDAFRNDQSFVPLYMNKLYRRKFVLGENPLFFLSQRIFESLDNGLSSCDDIKRAQVIADSLSAEFVIVRGHLSLLSRATDELAQPALQRRLQGVAHLPATLAAWERTERPITEHTQRISVLLGLPTTWPPWLRSFALALAGRSQWLTRQRTRTALHSPTGT
jgi:FRG domain